MWWLTFCKMIGDLLPSCFYYVENQLVVGSSFKGCWLLSIPLPFAADIVGLSCLLFCWCPFQTPQWWLCPLRFSRSLYNHRKRGIYFLIAFHFPYGRKSIAISALGLCPMRNDYRYIDLAMPVLYRENVVVVSIAKWFPFQFFCLAFS